MVFSCTDFCDLLSVESHQVLFLDCCFVLFAPFFVPRSEVWCISILFPILAYWFVTTTLLVTKHTQHCLLVLISLWLSWTWFLVEFALVVVKWWACSQTGRKMSGPVVQWFSSIRNPNVNKRASPNEKCEWKKFSDWSFGTKGNTTENTETLSFNCIQYMLHFFCCSSFGYLRMAELLCLNRLILYIYLKIKHM